MAELLGNTQYSEKSSIWQGSVKSSITQMRERTGARTEVRDTQTQGCLHCRNVHTGHTVNTVAMYTL